MKRITFTVSNGWVTLEGTVDSWAQHEDAERAVRNLSGIGNITNLDQYRGARGAGGGRATAIEGALERRAEREPARSAWRRAKAR